MCMTTIFRDGDYELVKHEEGRAPYAIFKRGKQVSQWYCTCGWADKKLKQLLKGAKK
jgi:hypothetical protein